MKWRLIQKKKEIIDMAFEFCVDLKMVVSSLPNPTFGSNMTWHLIQKKKEMLEMDSMVK